MNTTTRVKNIWEGLSKGDIPAIIEDKSVLVFDTITTIDKKGNKSTTQITVMPFDTDKDKFVKFKKCMLEKQNEQLPENIIGKVKVNITTHKDNERSASTIDVLEGKNIGKKNATNTIIQAIYEAHSLYKKKVQTTNNPHILPMLLKNINDKPLTESDLQKGVYVERKFDGVRVISHKEKGKVIMHSRTGKAYSGLTEIEEELDLLIGDSNIYLDGELYIHDVPLQDISGAVRGKNNKLRNQLTLYIYDCLDTKNPTMDQQTRKEILTMLFNNVRDLTKIQLVRSKLVYNEDAIEELYNKFIVEGYEGAILRKIDNVYEQGKNGARSSGVLKKKQMFTDEFKIVDYEEGKRGKDKGAVIFIMETDKGHTFNAVPNMTLEDRKKLFGELEKNTAKFNKEYLEKEATIQYSTLSKNGVPQQPKFITVRDYE